MIIAILITCLGLVNLRFDLLHKNKRAWTSGQIRRLLIGVPLCALWVYFTLPAMVNWVGYTVLLLPLGVNASVTILTRLAKSTKGQRLAASGGLPLLTLVASLLIPFYLNALVIPLQATSLRDVPTVKEVTEKMPIMNPEHIRLVSIETARWKAQKTVGELGTGFEVGDLSVQMVNNRLYWVAPLEFRGLFKWLSFKQTPGFVMIDGENPDAAATMHNSPITYSPSAFFGHDLTRHVYATNSNSLLFTANFELDDNLKPWYVVSLGQPTVGHTGARVTGAVLVNPESGKLEQYSLETVPTWVDEVIPEEIAEQHNVWFGRYVHGFWNSWFGQKDVHLPTGWGEEVDVYGVIGADNRFYWFTGHTSPSANDDSLMGYTMTDGRTGVINYYRSAVGYYNEGAAISSVNAAVSNYAGWHGAQPLLYNLYGAESYLVPVLSENNQLQAVGVVNAKTGQTIVKPSKAEALLIYRQYLGSGVSDATPTQGGTTKTLQAKIARVGEAVIAGNTMFYLHLEGSTRIYTANAGLSAEVVLTRPGDPVSISFLDTAETTVSLSSFDNLALPNK